MSSFFGRLGVALALFVLGCSIEHPTQRDAGACGISGTPCCRLDAGIRLDASGLMSNGCGNGLSCVSGTCQACPSGQRLCGTGCVSVTDNSHCGGCNNACAVGFTCMTGSGDAGTPSCERVCPPGQNRCGGGNLSICTDLAVDTQNCGTCGTSCAARMLPNVATPACNGGMCAVGTCAANFANCDMSAANGCEVNTQTSTMHCGGCGRACVPPANATPTCSGGTCDFRCLPGFSDCDRNPANGCETNLNTDPRNCMMCGQMCPTQAGQTATCNAGVCGTTTTLMCPAGTGDCNTMAGDGCETNINTTLAHCGACGMACSRANAISQCLAGSCLLMACTAPNQNCDGIPDNGCETNLNSSTTHCGRCGNFCNFPNASPSCMNGTCALASCNVGFANCNNMAVDGCEIDTRTNTSHCGGCNMRCGVGQQCIAGTCQLVCVPGTDACNGICVNRQTDRANCGVCGRLCAPGEVCSAGVCTTSCDPRLTDCSGNCVNTLTDRDNCGPVGASSCGRACASGQICRNGTCVLSCPTGQTPCGSTCINLTNDPANCNGCGTSCSGRFANSAPNCVNSACALGTCNPGFGNCDNDAPNGCETNLSTTTSHCGACGRACTFPNASASCANSACVLGACNSGFGNCDGIAENGCETNLNASVTNCMRCNNVCPTPTGRTPTCIAGVCGSNAGMCPAGTGDCNGGVDGCETNIFTSNTHCGSCGQACTRNNASASCTGGACVLGSCGTGFGNCNGDPGDGCETNLNASTAHCGGCGRPCFFPNASSPTCSSGACQLGACNSGFANCNGMAPDGCEVSLQSDRNNCGMCGRSCASGEVCSNGVCTLMCGGGTTNCSGNCVNTQTDRDNCGGCSVTGMSRACPSGQVCQNGSCVLSCPSGQTACGNRCVDLTSDSANCGMCGMTCSGGRVCSTSTCVCSGSLTFCGGSCVDRQTNVAHCGACNNACPSGQVCSSGTCVTTCASGTTNCSGSCVNTQSSLAHCGACGNVCMLMNASNGCTAGNCTIASCTSGFDNCNSTTGDGCEVNITNTVAHCGACNNNCLSFSNVTGATCSGGSCTITTCAANRSNCDGNVVNGCETNTQVTLAHCGQCGTNCANLPAVASAMCSGGACNIMSCDPNFSDCDNVATNGCEVNLNVSTSNCSACGVSCPSGGMNNTLSNACLSGLCNCTFGYGDCDSNRVNGCETHRQTNNQHCGNCGIACTGTGNTCAGGACQSACGEATEPCCTGDTCGAGLTCTAGTCMP